jgi:hypothetical protein
MTAATMSRSLVVCGVAGVVLLVGAALADEPVVSATIDLRHPLSTFDADALVSTTIDISTLVNGDHCNFSNPRLHTLARQPRFRYMRVGGTRGDTAYF